MTLEFPTRTPDCRQLEAVLPPFVDGEATPAVRATVEAHLAECASCRDAVDAQRAVRALLVTRRATLSEAAPHGLAAEVRRVAVLSRAQSPARWSRLSAFAAAAAVVLAVTGGLSWATGHSSVLLAAQLTLDHLKCFVIDGDDHDHPMTADAAQAHFHQDFGMDVRLPTPPADTHARLVSVRQCLYGEGWIAHALYRVDGEAVSLFVMRGKDVGRAEIDAFGRHATVVTKDDATYVLVAPARLSGVADAVGLEAE
jgi:anti-sigma factor (TIGR02949 family)